MMNSLWTLVLVGGMLPTLDLTGDVAPVSAQLDELARARCQAAGVTPLGKTTDAEFLRRVWLDLAGRTPPVEAAAKVQTKSLDRSAVAASLLQSSDHAQHWGRMWTEYLTDRRPFDQQEYDPRRLQHYLTNAVRENTSYDRLVEELLTGDGWSDASGPVNFLLRYNAEPAALAGAVSQKFLGTSLQCAECHDHPHTHWKQQEFWGLAAHFARLRKMAPSNPPEGENAFIVEERPRGELTREDKTAAKDEAGKQPRKTVFPQLPGQVRTDAERPRRAVLVEWLKDGENPYLSRHAVNLIWERLLGAKLVDNFDDWPADASRTEVQILNLLAEDFVEHGFDVQRLILVIVVSDTYQRSARAGDASSDKPAAPQAVAEELLVWSRARARPLSADQLHLSLAQAFGYHFDENDFRLAEATGEEFTYDLPTATFGSTPNSLTRATALYNSDHVRGAVELGAEVLVRLYGSSAGPEHIERLFLSLLTRKPTAKELELFQEIAGTGEIRQGLQDAAWVILNSAEFVTNH